MSETKPQAIMRAIIPAEKKPSGYTRFEPVPHYGRMQGSQTVEVGDEDEPRFSSGWEELRRNALKAPRQP
jgi:hypothetical protein